MATTPVFLSGELHGQRSLVDYIPWGHKESHTHTQLTTNTFTFIIGLRCPLFLKVNSLRPTLVGGVSSQTHPKQFRNKLFCLQGLCSSECSLDHKTHTSSLGFPNWVGETCGDLLLSALSAKGNSGFHRGQSGSAH